MLLQLVMTLGLLLNTTSVNITDDSMIVNEKINTPIIVRVTGSITEGSAELFARKMYAAKATGQSIIPIVISSYGGSVYALFKMIDVIDEIKKDTVVATIIIGKAMSAGITLASCGTEGMRFASPYATMMIHEVSSASRGKIISIESDTKETVRLNELLLGIISVNIGKSRSYIADMIQIKGHADWFLTVKDALEHNLINKIGVPNLTTKATVTLTLE